MMSKPTGALFGILTIVAIVTIAPHAFAATTQVQMSPGAGSGQSCVSANNCFSPNVVNIAVGDTITWTNNDKVGHTTTSGQPSDNQTGTVWDSSLVAAGKSYSFTFQNAGDYKYFCMVHPWMTGEVIVGAAASPATSGQGQQGGIPLGSSYTAPANMSSTPTTPPAANLTEPSSQAAQVQQGSSQIAQQSGQGQQGGIPLGSSYTAASSSQASTTSPPAGISYNDSNNPYGPLSGMAWAAGLAIAGVLSGIGVWTAVRRR